MPDDVQLLPCPFCGGEALSCRVDRKGRSTRYRVFCRSCSCRTEDEKTRDDAIAAWNTRAETQALRAEIARAREALHRLVDHCEQHMPAANWWHKQPAVAAAYAALLPAQPDREVGWEWWAGHLGEDIYDIASGATRAEVIAAARREIGATETFRIVEARSSTAAEYEGDEWVPFLRTRNHEIIEAEVSACPRQRRASGGRQPT